LGSTTTGVAERVQATGWMVGGHVQWAQLDGCQWCIDGAGRIFGRQTVSQISSLEQAAGLSVPIAWSGRQVQVWASVSHKLRAIIFLACAASDAL
ncbi:MAG: hypothetical protein ACXAEN_26900, partial [Candidatus Thorarchaeota archaeon]